MCDERSTSRLCSSNTSIVQTSLMTPSLTDQTPSTNENLMKNFFELISNELRRLRHRINDSDEASQDRHSQLMQLLFSSFNLNNSNNLKKL